MSERTPAYVALDTETTGIPGKTERPGDPDHPRIVELAAILLDQNGDALTSIQYLFRPDGWEIDEDDAVHPWTQEDCLIAGVDGAEILRDLSSFIDLAPRVIAHHAIFDAQMIAHEALIRGLANPMEGAELICTMLESTEICKIPFHRGLYKYPALSEAADALGVAYNPDGLHAAEYDADLARRIFKKLRGF